MTTEQWIALGLGIVGALGVAWWWIKAHPTHTVEYYKERSKKGDWRWRLKARNGLNVASSGEGFGAPDTARESYRKAAHAIRWGRVRERVEE